MKKVLLVMALVIAFIPAFTGCGKTDNESVLPATSAPSLESIALSSEGKRNLLPSGGYFAWRFDKKPQIGPLIVILQAYSKEGKKESPYEITGEYGMPGMRAHDSGPVPFQMNKKGDYLLPIQIAMPGPWEMTLRIKRNGKSILVGTLSFEV
jgi:hypothetical protein